MEVALRRGRTLRGGDSGAEMWCHIPVPPQEPAAAQLPSPAPAPLVIYSLFLKLFWESVKTEPGAGASPLEPFCSRQDSALDGFGAGWWQEQRSTSVPGRNKPCPLFPPSHCPCKTCGKQLEGTGWWERQQDPGKRRGWGIYMAWVGDL